MRGAEIRKRIGPAGVCGEWLVRSDTAKKNWAVGKVKRQLKRLQRNTHALRLALICASCRENASESYSEECMPFAALLVELSGDRRKCIVSN